MPQCRVALDVALVGTGGTIPLPNRWLASTLVRWENHLVLFDCGEGTQISMRGLGWGFKDVDLILISHVHADHIAGLTGVLLAQAQSGRREPVRLYGPRGLSHVVNSLRILAPVLPFEVHCRDLFGGEAFSHEALRFSTVQGEHAVPCIAYRVDLPRAPRFLPDRATELGVPRPLWSVLQGGQPVVLQKQRIEPEQVQGPPRPGLAVGLVTDTRPTQPIANLVRGADLLVCEGTFGSSDEAQRAAERKHMTFAEAAGLAASAEVRQLILTHFSASLLRPDDCVSEARAIFPNTTIGQDHLSLTLRFPTS